MRVARDSRPCPGAFSRARTRARRAARSAALYPRRRCQRRQSGAAPTSTTPSRFRRRRSTAAATASGWAANGRRTGPGSWSTWSSRAFNPATGCSTWAAARCAAVVHFVEYLEPGNYYGVDINETLLDAGYERELTPELQAKLPRDHLRATERFDCDFGVPFDFAIAQSLFSHISFNQIRLCLYRVAKEMQPGGRFLSTFFVAPPEHPLDEPRDNGACWSERNVFFYYYPDLSYVARGMPWQMNYIGDWKHPRGQVMVEYLRVSEPPTEDAPLPPQTFAASPETRQGPSLGKRIERGLKRRLQR